MVSNFSEEGAKFLITVGDGRLPDAENSNAMRGTRKYLDPKNISLA